jgi:predicted secreted acid phosphatase
MTNATGTKMALEKELETYNAKLPELKAQEGKYVLIHGDQVVDTYGTYEDAMKEGYAKFGLGKPFLVKQIRSIEQVQFISRLVIPCHTSPSK